MYLAWSLLCRLTALYLMAIVQPLLRQMAEWYARCTLVNVIAVYASFSVPLILVYWPSFDTLILKNISSIEQNINNDLN